MTVQLDSSWDAPLYPRSIFLETISWLKINEPGHVWLFVERLHQYGDPGDLSDDAALSLVHRYADAELDAGSASLLKMALGLRSQAPTVQAADALASQLLTHGETLSTDVTRFYTCGHIVPSHLSPFSPQTRAKCDATSIHADTLSTLGTKVTWTGSDSSPIAAPPVVMLCDLLSPSCWSSLSELRTGPSPPPAPVFHLQKQAPGQLRAAFQVPGWAVEFAYKNTEYNVVDKVDRTEAAGQDQEDLSAEVSEESGADEASGGTSWLASLARLRSAAAQASAGASTSTSRNLTAAHLGLRAIAYLVELDKAPGSSVLSALAHMTSSLPAFAPELAGLPLPDQKNTRALAEHCQTIAALHARSGTISVAGLTVDMTDASAFRLAELITYYYKHARVAQTLGLGEHLHALLSRGLLTSEAAGTGKAAAEGRSAAPTPIVFDVRSPNLFFVNDLEKDARYQNWPRSLEALPTMLEDPMPLLARNLGTIVYVYDPSSVAALGVMLQLVRGVAMRTTLRVGLMWTWNNEAETVAGTAAASPKAVLAALRYLSTEVSSRAAISFLERAYDAEDEARLTVSTVRSALSSLLDVPQAKIDAWLTGNFDEEERLYLDEAAAFSTRFPSLPTPALFLNGQLVEPSNNMLQDLLDMYTLMVRWFADEVQAGRLDDTFDGSLFDHYLTAHAALPSRHPVVFPSTSAPLQMLAIDEVTTLVTRSADDRLYFYGGDSSEGQVHGEADGSESPVFRSELTVLLDAGSAPSVAYVRTLKSMLEVAGAAVDVDLVLYGADYGACAAVAMDVCGVSLAQTAHRAHQALIEKLAIKEEPEQAGAVTHTDSRISSPPILALLLHGRVIVRPDSKLAPRDVLTLLEVEARVKGAPLAAGVARVLGHKAKAALLPSLLTLRQSLHVAGGGLFRDVVDAAGAPLALETLAERSPYTLQAGSPSAPIRVCALVDPLSEHSAKTTAWLDALTQAYHDLVRIDVLLYTDLGRAKLPPLRFYRAFLPWPVQGADQGATPLPAKRLTIRHLPSEPLLTLSVETPSGWLVLPSFAKYDLDNLKLQMAKAAGENRVEIRYKMRSLLIEGQCYEKAEGRPPRGLQIELWPAVGAAGAAAGQAADQAAAPHASASHASTSHASTATSTSAVDRTIVMANLGYFQFQAAPGVFEVRLREGRSRDLFQLVLPTAQHTVCTWDGLIVRVDVARRPGMEHEALLEGDVAGAGGGKGSGGLLSSLWQGAASAVQGVFGRPASSPAAAAPINIFSVASGHLYERFLRIMIWSVLRHTTRRVKFWFIANFLSPTFMDTLPFYAAAAGFEYELVMYKWPSWLRPQTEKQRTIWGYKILFLDVLFPLALDKVIFVDADQVVRVDMATLLDEDLGPAPYGFAPFCDSRPETDGFRFWKDGYWAKHLRGKPYHISALFVVDLGRFRQLAAGDLLRGQYHTLSADPGSLANLDQDLPNNMQDYIPIHTLDASWLWCETWCSDASKAQAKTIDLCNNPLTKEPKLDRAKRILPEWTGYDKAIRDMLDELDKWRAAGAGAGAGAAPSAEHLAAWAAHWRAVSTAGASASASTLHEDL